MSEETKNIKQEQVDYSKYTFAPEAKMEINGQTFAALNNQLQLLLEKEVVRDVKIRSKRINIETGKEVKKETKNTKGKVRLVFDPQATMQAQLEERLTDKGQTILKLIEILNNVHFINVDKGNGILVEELAKRYQDAQTEQ